jgi:hypothetical protein
MRSSHTDLNLQLGSLGELGRVIGDNASTHTSQELLHSLSRPVQTVGDPGQQVIETPHVLGFVIAQHLLELVLKLLVVALNQHLFTSTSELNNQSR